MSGPAQRVSSKTALSLMGSDQPGRGLFAMPAAIEAQVRRQHRARVVRRLGWVRQRLSAITAERKLRNRAVIAIFERAPTLFGREFGSRRGRFRG